jgi:hypothetical protein
MLKLQLFLILFLFSGCGNKSIQHDNFTNLNTKKNDSVHQKISGIEILPDSIKTITPDDYPVTNEMFREIYNADQLMKIKSGDIYSISKAWFTNDTLNQTLVFELYTDFHRFFTYHFQNENILDTIISQIKLYHQTTSGYETVSMNEKKPFFSGIIQGSKRISQKYFISNKGLKLNDNRKRLIDIYGEPDKKYPYKDIECNEWSYYGDAIYRVNKNNIDLKGKKLAKNSFGYEVKAYFKNDRLIGIILINDIP